VEEVSRDVLGPPPRGANEKGRPKAAFPVTYNRRPYGREPSPSGEDLQLSGDPGHGSGWPRL